MAATVSSMLEWIWAAGRPEEAGAGESFGESVVPLACASSVRRVGTRLHAHFSREMQNDHRNESTPAPAVAYLLIRDGDAWRDVFRLSPEQVTTIGRAPTNRIVVRDEICSRHHCEIFRSGAQWTLRDLGSRNGTLIDGSRVAGDWDLEDGEMIRIGTCEMGFTYDLARPFAKFHEDNGLRDGETAVDLAVEHAAGPQIVHRTRDSRFRSSGDEEARDRTSRQLARLYRLALDMGGAGDVRRLAEVVLDGLFGGTCADIGAILLLPEGTTAEARPDQLRVISYRSPADLPYQKVSNYLSRLVLESREAVLARDVAEDSRLSTRDSLGEIHAQSVICAPIRRNGALYGLVHLYSTNPDNPLDPDDLEFTLAVADQLAIGLGNLTEKESLAAGLARVQDENLLLRRQLELESELIGESPAMQLLRDTICRIAPTDATALVRGESGVGKELVARAIHFGSHRRNGPFVCMNCAALSESLLESELFGHEKGSFTGAVGRKIGKFEQAHKGTLFLDEVGEMSLSIQAKFLRLLEGHPFERVGGGTPVEVDVRVVAATNRNLEHAVEGGTFRKDLYFRLHVAEVFVEPLRERRADVPLLANHFLARFARKANRPVKRFTQRALDALMNYDWPGNVRELQNAIERGVILSASELLDESDIRLSGVGQGEARRFGSGASGRYREVSLEILEQEHILATLERTNWNKSRAAQILGIERSTLDRKLKRYRVKRPSRDSSSP